jgi:hypothetical protein
MNRRQLLKTAAALPLIQAGLKRGALAQTGYPNRNITMIVPFPAGQADLAARPVALALARVLGKPFIVDNRAGGAGGSIGNAQAARGREGAGGGEDLRDRGQSGGLSRRTGIPEIRRRRQRAVDRGREEDRQGGVGEPHI